MIKQYLKLLMSREGKEVLGKNGSNLWLLTIVLVATFASIAFSEGSMIYLRDKMEDPFTNWVSITKGDDDNTFIAFREALSDPENMARFGYTEVQIDQYTNYTFQGIDEKHQHFLECRFFEHMNTPLVHAILNDENVIDGCEVDSALLMDKTLGFIITLDAAKKLGYSPEELPTYIQYLAASVGADSLGLKLVQNELMPVSLPVLAVVRRLPNNVDMVAANFFYEQQHFADNHPFDFALHEEYQHKLLYYVSDEVGEKNLCDYVKSLLPDSLKTQFEPLESPAAANLKCWKSGKMMQLDLSKNYLPRELYLSIADKVARKYNPDQVRRVYELATKEHPSQRSAYLSVSFASLDSIRSFEQFAKENFRIQLEMSQVSSKENFNAVTVMAAILSAAMVIFSIVCIIMFMVNMLQSYFQKVKRNLGTFKAFGMNTKELTVVYIIILILIVLSAVVFSLLITWGIQTVLPMLGVEKEGFNYLSLWNNTTYTAAVVVLVSTVATVVVVMTRMLSQTPGDLIYDRN